ncbi:hypothetical protein FC83_GL002431 [Agrilactobacillus composti DSM 18527 = JCM 14202]|uniref:Ferredoxin n=1 Tax=Agrilactobacillus composti DSM 18527 = JCM 14202 TaxID=1423734 RepID=X0PDF6_9LACO|nr:ferredoxin [Agrilactobacillus composti]KRM36559.1 hypothetical protein FC83_GL002431 [Agrilactobacillus composti DSM 18527 = JCM 14202]GAF39124.1 ferredoxin [Agrilactobacillus composti DSM 18527 = JCM 14202]
MYTKVEQIDCIACGICQLKAPQIFDYQPDGIAFCKLDNNQGQQALPNQLLPQFKLAYQQCPTGAIKRRTKPF